MFYILTSLALAETILIVDTDVPEYQLERAKEVLQSDATEINVTVWADLQSQSPPLEFSKDVAFTTCEQKPVSLDLVRTQLTVVEQSFFYMELESLKIHRDRLLELLLCVDEPIDPQILVRSYFLNGIASDVFGDEAGSHKAYRQALAIDPTLEWDEELNPTLKKSFEYVKYKVGFEKNITIENYLIDSFPVYWNGSELPNNLQIAKGNHIVQIQSSDQIFTYVVDLPENSWHGIHSLKDLPSSIHPDKMNESESFRISTELKRLYPEKDVYILSKGKLWTYENSAFEPMVKVARKPLGLLGSGVLLGLGSAAHVVSYQYYEQFHDSDTHISELESLQKSTNAYFFSALGLYGAATYLAWESK